MIGLEMTSCRQFRIALTLALSFGLGQACFAQVTDTGTGGGSGGYIPIVTTNPPTRTLKAKAANSNDHVVVDGLTHIFRVRWDATEKPKIVKVRFTFAKWNTSGKKEYADDNTAGPIDVPIRLAAHPYWEKVTSGASDLGYIDVGFYFKELDDKLDPSSVTVMMIVEVEAADGTICSGASRIIVQNVRAKRKSKSKTWGTRS